MLVIILCVPSISLALSLSITFSHSYSLSSILYHYHSLALYHSLTHCPSLSLILPSLTIIYNLSLSPSHSFSLRLLLCVHLPFYHFISVSLTNSLTHTLSHVPDSGIWSVSYSTMLPPCLIPVPLLCPRHFSSSVLSLFWSPL